MDSTNRTITVLIVDDHPVVARGLTSILQDSSGFSVVGVAADGEEALEMALRLEPDVIIMDVMMPRLDGIEACRRIMDLLPATRVLMLTASTEKDAVIESVAAGAMGYLQKYSQGEALQDALLALANGSLRIPEDALKRSIDLVRGELWDKTHSRPVSALTARERELLVLFASGDPYARIAEAKSISPVTVRNTIARIQEKLGLSNKQELVVWAVRNGLVEDR